MQEIKISIIMPIYNPKIEYLKQALESIINQTYSKIELIIILDGSGKETEEFCKTYQKKDSRIKIYKQKNKGEGAARNAGIQKANNEWITFVDPDDWLELDAIEKMQKAIKESTKKSESIADIIIFDTYIDYKNKKIRNKFYTKEGILDGIDKEEIQLQNIGQGICKYYPKECNISVAWAKIYRKQFIIKDNLKFYENIKRYTDTIFNIEAFEKAEEIVYYNEYIYNYRKNNLSITHNYYEKMKEDINIFLRQTNKYIKDNNKNDKFKQTYYLAVVSKIIQFLEMAYGKIKIELEIQDFKRTYGKELKNANNIRKSLYQKLMLKNIECENIFMIKVLIIIKKILKKFFRYIHKEEKGKFKNEKEY